MRISDWSSDVCSSDLLVAVIPPETFRRAALMLSAMRVVPPRRRCPDGRLSGAVPGKSVSIVPGGPHRRTGWMGLVRETAPAPRPPTFPCSARDTRHNRDHAAMVTAGNHHKGPKKTVVL